MGRKQPKPIHQLTIAQFERMFPDEDACCTYRRWGCGAGTGRTRAGLASARARGRKGGRPKKLNDREWRAIRTLVDARELTIAEITSHYDVSPATIYRRRIPRPNVSPSRDFGGSGRENFQAAFSEIAQTFNVSHSTISRLERDQCMQQIGFTSPIGKYLFWFSPK